ncbi:HAD family hydrolase [Lysobacter sp. TY2-98]|uniref:HAD family hydrolase n=1 Tax=Lysobacter sp. TY2-98 TaxID=2290922 RepID=UPI000E1FB7E1|nr:HAD family hydrolase [Lysobacter sp. TY2-98]AXK72966.1 HAD family hydrolase [Lysobacter sp. TY2-98]
MTFRIRAITLDLDDTLWPIAPAIDRAEQALDTWLATHAPRAAAQWPLAVRQRLRLQVDAERPEMAHDMTAQRQWMLERMFAEAGEDPALVHGAFEAYFAARCEVEHYPDTLDALERLAMRVPLASVSNGNACLTRIGLMPLFRFQLGAREHGAAKPTPSIYLEACQRLGVAPHDVLHVGDDVELDVVGAARAGLRTCWIDRRNEHWPRHDVRPDLHFTDLAALADWLDAHLATEHHAA